MATREENKAERRRRIIDAARRLIGETGETGFSMRALAEQANVSLATPYNLFGSKQSILQEVLNADLAIFAQEISEHAPENTIERLFAPFAILAEHLRSEPQFYSALIRSLLDAGGLTARETFAGQRFMFWRRLVNEAIKSGAIARNANAEFIARCLIHVITAVLLDWVANNTDLDRVEAELGYDAALILSSVVTGKARQDIARRLASYDSRLSAYAESRASGRKTAEAAFD